MFEYIRLFSIFSVCNLVFIFLNYWQIKNAKKFYLPLFSFLGVQPHSLWQFWFWYSIIVSFILVPVNYIFLYNFWYGYNQVFNEKVWRVQEIAWLANGVVMFFMAWFYMKELPTLNTLIVVFFLAGAIIAILWGKQP